MSAREGLALALLAGQPDVVRLRLEADQALLKKVGLSSFEILSIGEATKVPLRGLIAAGVRAYKGDGRSSVESTSRVRILVSVEGGAAMVRVGRKRDAANGGGRIRWLELLSPDASSRRGALRYLDQERGFLGGDWSGYFDLVEERALTEQEIGELVREVSRSPARSLAELGAKLTSGSATIEDLPLTSVEAYSALCGPLPGSASAQEYWHGPLVGWRRDISKRSIRAGLVAELYGGVLADEHLADRFADVPSDDLWNAIQDCDVRSSPIAELNAVALAVSRPDSRVLAEAARESVERLCADEIAGATGENLFELHALVAHVVCNLICRIPGALNQPPYWRRLCSWTHGGLIAREMSRAGIDVDAFRQLSEPRRQGELELVRWFDLLEEPRASSGEFSGPALRSEIVGRLLHLRELCQARGYSFPSPDVLDRALERELRHQRPLAPFMPGPLEGTRAEIERRQPVDWDLLEGVSDANLAAVASVVAQAAKLSNSATNRLENRLELMKVSDEERGEALVQESMTELAHIAVATAADQNPELGEKAAQAIRRIAASNGSGALLWLVVRSLCAVAASRRDVEEARDFFGRMMAEVCEEMPTGEGVRLLARFVSNLRRFRPELAKVLARSDALLAAAIQ